VAARYVSTLLQVSGTTLADIHRVHMLVGPAAARLLTEKFSTTAPAILRACLAEGYKNIDNDSEYGIAAARFRNKLIELTDLPPLAIVMNILSSIFEACWATATVAAGEQIDNSSAKRKGLRSMKKLIDLIESGDADAAEAHWLKHTEYVQKTMSNWFQATRVIDILDGHD
jgi:DNA-binding GntR family transcriptional regulator